MRLVFIGFSFLLLSLPTAVLGQSSTASGISNKMNPALSVNGLFLAQKSLERHGVDYNGINLQEAEMHFSSVVDPFWKANIIVSVFPESDGTAYGLGVEEASLKSSSLPVGFNATLGKFFIPFGKHSPMHTHHFSFVDAPVSVMTFLGEGATDCGVMLEAALPLSWYSDAIVYCVDGRTETFDAGNSDLAFGGRVTSFWDLSEEATFELGGSALSGPGSEEYFGRADWVSVYGIDMTYKWICGTTSHGHALTVQAEFILPNLSDDYGQPYGWYALSQYRLHHNWWLGVCHGLADTDIDPGATGPGLLSIRTRESKLNVTFAPSEFSALRAEVAFINDQVEDIEDVSFRLQWNFTIGSHPAHQY